MSDEIRINTDSLRSYAGQLDSIQRQIYALNAEIRSFRYHTGKLWNVNTYGYEWTINPAKSYCVDTANEFESIERYLQGCDPEMYEGKWGDVQEVFDELQESVSSVADGIKEFIDIFSGVISCSIPDGKQGSSTRPKYTEKTQSYGWKVKWDYFDKTINKKIKEKLKKDGSVYGGEGEVYFKNGKKVKKEKVDDLYERKLTIFSSQYGGETIKSSYHTELNNDYGEFEGYINKTTKKAVATGGFYIVGNDGKKVFSPGLDFEVGAGYTALEGSWNKQLLGDENFGLDMDAKVSVGKAGVDAKAQMQVFDDSGKLDLQGELGASAEVMLFEAEAKANLDLLGADASVAGEVNFGFGAHGNVGFKDGVIKLDGGVSFGLGFSVSTEIDISGAIEGVNDIVESAYDLAENVTDTACGMAEAAWDGVKDGWDKLKSLW